MPIRWHAEAPDDLRAALRFTAEETGFLPRLLEKDYFCSVVLEAIADSDVPLVFKGGTCLAKVHAGFFRLSEDLDFSISTPLDATRADRRRAIASVKDLIQALPSVVPELYVATPLAGHNSSTQYNATLQYRSLLGDSPENLEIEIGLREPVLSPVELPAHTCVLHWIRQEPFVEPFGVRSLSYAETMAEKFRAALCRRDVAIRDFFDVDHEVSSGRLRFDDSEILELLRTKIGVPGTLPMDVSAERLGALRVQLEAQLRPVLREREFRAFDLGRATAAVRSVGLSLAG